MLTLIRSTFFNILMPSSAILLTVVAWPCLFKREWAFGIASNWAKVMLIALKYICGLKHNSVGLDKIPSTPHIFASKHQSMWETLALAATINKPCFVLKKELFDIPVFGWWCKAAGFIGVDRSAGARAMRDMLNKAQLSINEGYNIVIFPEGTRIQPGETGEYHPGIAGLYSSLKIPCVPVSHNSGCFWVYPGVKRKAGEITLHFGAPIAPGTKRKAFMEKLQLDIETVSLELAALSTHTSSDLEPQSANN